MAYFPSTAEGVLSTVNSTTSTLGVGGVFTGTSEEIILYSSVTVYVFSSHASATDGLSMQQSSDGTNWDVLDTYTITAMSAGQGRTYGVQVTGRYFRVVYTNGGVAQTTFRLQTIYHKIEQRTSSTRPQDARTNEVDVTESAAYLMGYNGTSWDRLRSDTTNGLDVDVTRSALPTGAATSANQSTMITALQLIDDPVATLGTTTYTEATSKAMIIGAVRRDADTTLVDTTNEIAPLQVDANGRLKVEAFSGETLPVSLTSTTITGTVAVTDNASSLTVDAPVGTPVFVRLSDGSSAISTLPVSLASVPSHAVTNAGTFAVQVDGNALTALQLIDDTVFVDDAAFTVATSKVNATGFMADEVSTDSVDEGDIGIARMTLDRKQIVSLGPHTTGGLTTYHLVSAGSTNATNIKNSAGQVFGWYIYNSNASARKVAFHNTSGTPTAGSSVFFSLVIPPTSGANVEMTNGITFSSGIAITTTTGLADSDSAAVAANDLVINIFYK